MNWKYSYPSFNKKEIAVAIFPDFEGALPKSIGSALVERGVKAMITGWIYALLINRTATTTIQDEAIRLTVTRGNTISPFVVTADGRVT